MDSKLVLLFATDFGSLAPVVQKEVYNEFYKTVYGATFYIIKDHSATEDIIQEAFMRIINYAPNAMYEESKSLAWIKVVTKNVALNYLKKNKKFRDQLASDIVLLYKPDVSISVEDQVENKMLEESIKTYLDQISPGHRRLIEMRWKGNLSYKQMAQELKETEGAVRQKLARARENVKKKLLREWSNKK